MIPSPRARRAPEATATDSLTWVLLRDGVPITLLCDLLFPAGPPSRQILASEVLADDVRLSHPDSGSTGRADVSITGT